MKKLKTIGTVLKEAFLLLKRKDPLILSSSTAFFTTFSLTPIILILVNIFSLSFQDEKMNNKLFNKLASVVGDKPALEVQTIVTNVQSMESNGWITLLSFVFFVFVATTLLGVIKQNIHKLWHIRSGTKIKDQLLQRLAETGMILFTGVLILISLLMDTSLAISLDYLLSVLPGVGIVVIKIFNIVFSIIVVTSWFTMIFKFLPDAKVDWDVAITGAFLTAILFDTGKYVLGKVLIHARLETIFGASASIALLLLFIFYSSFILYYGAAFTREYGEVANKHICAGKFSHEYEEKLIESLD
jgi:membrane protein